MSDLVLRVHGLSKVYRIATTRERYDTLRDRVAASVASLFRRRRRAGSEAASPNAKYGGEVRALNEVSFEVRAGEVVGIIGRNGAGKTTLLKVLSRITEPTQGSAEIRGRIASLLEVGTGFHPELTGRENVYLNGAILGMHKVEIDRRFDEIIEFAEVARFIDTPVKRYSSGMYVRLAFAVAAHLESEILFVDEVLAVGDWGFQRKCLGKMGDVAREGRTVLFVSHNLAAIESLCTRGILLQGGCVSGDGLVREVTEQYMRSFDPGIAEPLVRRRDRLGNGRLRFASFGVKPEAGGGGSVLHSGRDAILRIELDNHEPQPLERVRIALGIDNHLGHRIALISNQVSGQDIQALMPGRNSLEIRVAPLPLRGGRYRITLFAEVEGDIADWVQNAASFDVADADVYGTGRLPPEGQGDLLLNYAFRSTQVPS